LINEEEWTSKAADRAAMGCYLETLKCQRTQKEYYFDSKYIVINFFFKKSVIFLFPKKKVKSVLFL
jgi:hypothetical protein